MPNPIDFSNTTAKIESVVITWRAADGMVRRMNVDTNRARGIIWRFDPKPGKRIDDFRGRRAPFPALPGTDVEVLGRTDKPVIQHPKSDGDVLCYWDEEQGEWICPDEPLR